MSYIEKIIGRMEDFIYWAVTGIVGAVASFGLLLVRKVFTSEKKIALLEADLKNREKAREEDRERMARIEEAQASTANGISQLQQVLIGKVSHGDQG